MKKNQLLDSNDNVQKYKSWSLQLKTRPVNRGKLITDNLPNLRIDPLVLDQMAAIEPLKEVIPPLSNKLVAGVVLEGVKLARRGQLINYGGGIIRGLTSAAFKQGLANLLIKPKVKPNIGALKKEIKDFAAKMGFALCGFTFVDRRFISEARDSVFPYDAAVVLGMEMDKALLNEAPSLGKKLFDFEVYVEAGLRVLDVARFIRSKGIRCIARHPFEGWVKFPPHAINAGLGELGAMGVVVTPQFGPRQRWCMISVDAEFEPDEPVDLGMAEYCDACLLCVLACPGKAISNERIWWRGVYKRKNNDTKCWPWFVRFDGCGICLKVCPINRYGYEACMDAFKNNGAILGKNMNTG